MCMVWPCQSFVDGLSNKCINVYIKKVKLINQDCLPILMPLYIMLYIMLAYLMLLYLMLFVCIMLVFFHLFMKILFVFMLCLSLLSHSLFISCVDLHHAQCF